MTESYPLNTMETKHQNHLRKTVFQTPRLRDTDPLLGSTELARVLAGCLPREGTEDEVTSHPTQEKTQIPMGRWSFRRENFTFTP